MGFSDYDGPTRITQLAPGVIMVSPVTDDEPSSALYVSKIDEPSPTDEPAGAYCACSDPDCPTEDGQYTHGSAPSAE